MRKSGILSALLALALTACGGGSSTNAAFVGSGTGGTGTKPTATPASLVITSGAASIPADGSVSTDVSALVRDSNNVVIGNIPVTLSASSGALSVGQTTTGADGLATATLTVGGDSTPRNIIVTAKAGTFTSTVTVAVGVAPSASPVAAMNLMSSAATIPSDGSVNATIVAITRDANNILMAGVPVSFTSSSGGLAITQGVTDSSGQATATLSTAGDPTLRNITVTATAGGITKTTIVAVSSTSSTTTVSIGNGSAASFQPNVLAVAVPSLSAGGSTSITVSIVKQDLTLYTSLVAVNFNSPCVAAGKASIQPSANATTTTGQATVTYASSGCAGPDVITATTTVGSQNLSATGTVTVAPATIGSVVYVSATPTNIALKGTGATGRPENSTVVFRVLDSAGGPVAGSVVNFALNTTVGGITLTSPSATSDSQGNVQAIVNAGTAPTPVTVSAVVAATPSIGTQSSQLTISTGIPTAGSFSLAVSCQNIEGWDYDGTIAAVTARLADRFSNPVPDGTAVSFQAEGGSILPQCQTTTTASEGGVCSVNFRSSNPRPADGRISLLATAIGEESFVDADGNGAFTVGDTFNASHDIGEPFRDDNENGVYDLGEPFYDFYNNGVTEFGIRNGPDGKFNGALCQDPARCPVDPLKLRAGIGAQNLIILSGSNPVLTNVSPTLSVHVNSAITVTIYVRDVNGNVMPGSTTVTGSVNGGGLAIGQPAAFSVPCTTQAANVQRNGTTLFSYSVSAGAATGSGTFTITVATPKGVTTLGTLPITVIP
jgi:hypothetical protein